MSRIQSAQRAVQVYRHQKRFPWQWVVYVGREPMNMRSELRGRKVLFEYDQIDMREVDGDRLLASPKVSDNVIGFWVESPMRTPQCTSWWPGSQSWRRISGSHTYDRY